MFIQTVNEKPLETSVMSPNFEMTAPTISKAVRMMNALIRSLLTFTYFLKRMVLNLLIKKIKKNMHIKHHGEQQQE